MPISEYISNRKMIPRDPERASKGVSDDFFFFFCHRPASLGLTGSLNTDLYDPTIMEDIHLQYGSLLNVIFN